MPLILALAGCRAPRFARACRFRRSCHALRIIGLSFQMGPLKQMRFSNQLLGMEDETRVVSVHKACAATESAAH